MPKKITCQTGLKKGIINKEVFDREIAICKEFGKGEGCCWGKCETCGVIPLLYKLHKGVLIDNGEEIEKLKKKLFGE
jgi:hypothetical protein